MDTRQSRRLFLAGAGVTLALPFLPSALWSRRAGAAACTPPRRFMAWFAPNGMNMQDWTPPTTDGTSAWDLTPILKPLAPIRNKILILTGLDHQDIAEPVSVSAFGTSVPEHPATSTGCFLNMITVRGHETDPARISLDQALLPALNGPGCAAPALPSLQIGIEGQYGQCGRTTCDFSRAISWTGGTALPPIVDPQACFDKMFVGTNLDAIQAAAQRAAQRKSVLDGVLAQLKSMSVTLSPSDRGRLDEHTTLVRNLETRLQRLGKSSGSTGPACAPPARPGLSAPFDPSSRAITPSEIIQTHVPLFVDLMVAAFQCDITRSITFMLGNGDSNSDYGFLFNGAPTPHHGTANNGELAAQQAKVTTIDTWEIQQAASLLQRLDGMADSDGRSILDHTTFYLSSDIHGLILAEWDLPVLVAGGASGRLKIDGRHVNYIPQMPFPRPSVGPRSPVQTGRVFISMLQAHGIMQDTFGMASGGPLPELMA